MVKLLSDNFGRTNASSWGNAAKVGGAYTTSGTAVYSTTGSYGKILAAANVVCNAMCNVPGHKDAELQGNCLILTLPTTFNVGFFLRYTDSNNYYFVRISETNFTISKKVAGVTTAIATYAGGSGPVANAWMRVRFKIVGTTLQAKWWPLANVEPAWQVQVVDATIASGNYIGCLHASSTATTYTGFDDIDVADYQDASFNILSLVDAVGQKTREVKDTEAEILSTDLGYKGPEYRDTDSLFAFTTAQSMVGEDYWMESLLALLADGGVVPGPQTQNNIDTDQEYMDVLSGTVSDERRVLDTNVLADVPTGMGVFTDLLILPSSLTDTFNTSITHMDTAIGALFDTYQLSNSVASTDAFSLIDSMTQETDNYKNLFEMLNDLQGPGIREYKTTENLFLLDAAQREQDLVKNIFEVLANSAQFLSSETRYTETTPASDLWAREEDITDSSTENIFLADGLVAMIAILESIGYSIEPYFTATGGVVGETTATIAQMLADLQGARQNATQLTEQLTIADNSKTEKNFSVTDIQSLFDAFAQSSEGKVLEALTLLDASNITFIKTDTTSVALADNQGPITNEKQSTSSDTPDATGALIGLGATLDQLLVTDTLSNATGQHTDNASSIGLDALVGGLQGTTSVVLLVLLVNGEWLIRFVTVEEGNQLNSTPGSVVQNIPSNLLKSVVWKIPNGIVVWEHPTDSVVWQTPCMVVAWNTPAMIAQWETPSMVVSWVLIE